MSEKNDTATVEALLTRFGQALLAVAEHQTNKGRPLANLNLESIVKQFQGDQAELISEVIGPNLDDLYVVSGRQHGDDEDCIWIIESKATDEDPDTRAIQELGGIGDEEDGIDAFYTTSTQLRSDIEERLIARPLKD